MWRETQDCSTVREVEDYDPARAWGEQDDSVIQEITSFVCDERGLGNHSDTGRPDWDISDVVVVQ